MVQYACLRAGIDDYYKGGFNTWNDAVLAGRLNTPKDGTFLVGKCVPVKVEDFVPDRPLELIMEQMNQDATDTCGDLCDSWPNDVNIPEQNIKAVDEAKKALAQGELDQQKKIDDLTVEIETEALLKSATARESWRIFGIMSEFVEATERRQAVLVPQIETALASWRESGTFLLPDETGELKPKQYLPSELTSHPEYPKGDLLRVGRDSDKKLRVMTSKGSFVGVLCAKQAFGELQTY